MTQIQIQQTFSSVGRGPAGLTWNGRYLFNADYTTNQIYLLDPENGQMVRKLICPGNLSGLTYTGSALWQSLHYGSTLTRMNPDTNDFDQTIALTDYGWLSGVAWDGNHLWIVSQSQGKLLQVNQEDGKVLQTLPCPVAGGGLDFHDGYLWLSVVETMRFDEAEHGFDWVGDEQNYAIWQIDPKTGGAVAKYATDFLAMGLTWVHDKLWLAHAPLQRLYVATLG